MNEAEKSELAQPHDLLVRNVLADADLAADLLKNYLDPKLVSALELDSLKREAGDTVSSELKKLVGDLRYSARFKKRDAELKVFVFLEHQSRPDWLISLRMVKYVCAAYEQQASGMKKGERFPYPLAVVLHHGKKPWKNLLPMRDLIAMPPPDVGVEDNILGLPIRLIDVAAMPVDELRGHPMVCALLDSLQSASTGALPARLRKIADRLRGLGGEKRLDSWTEALATYYYTLAQGEVENTIDELTQAFMGLHSKKEAKEMVMTVAEKLEVRGNAKGKAEAIVTVLKSRFDTVPATVQKKLMTLRDVGRAEEMLELALACQSLREFQKAL